MAENKRILFIVLFLCCLSGFFSGAVSIAEGENADMKYLVRLEEKLAVLVGETLSDTVAAVIEPSPENITNAVLPESFFRPMRKEDLERAGSGR